MQPLGGHKQNYRSILPTTLIYLAWRNIAAKKLRSGLTIVGIAIGIGAVYFLLSFGIGLNTIVTKEVLGNQSVRSISVDTPNSKILKLSTDSANQIQNLPHVSQLSTSFSFPGSIGYKGSQIQGIVYGIDLAYQNLTSLNLVEGRLLEKNDVRTALVNRSALKAMGIDNEKNIINQAVSLVIPLTGAGARTNEVEGTFTVVGVIDSGTGTEIFIPKFSFEAVGVPVYSDIKLLADDTENVPPLRKQIESIGFQTTSPLDTIDQINQIFRFFNVVLVGFGMVGMVVAVLGMFNTLTISLLQRTKEIGLMVALGARRKDMSRLFTIEATMLSIIGATSGIVSAVLLGSIVNLIIRQVAIKRGVTQDFSLFSYPFWLTIGIIIFMVLVGLLVAYYPSRRTQRINPIEALRRE